MKRFGLLLAVLGVGAGLYFGLFHYAPDTDQSGGSGIVISHKTAGLEHPENSEAGLRASLEMNVEAIELDVHVIRDGEVVLHHDPVLSDYNCFAENDPTRLIVAQQTVGDLKGLNCHNHKVDKPYKILTLADFLQIYSESDKTKKLLLEIKVWDELIKHNPLHVGLDSSAMHYPDKDVAAAVYDVLRQFPAVTNIQFNTFSRSLLLELRQQKQAEEGFEFGLLYKGYYNPIAMAGPALIKRKKCYDFCWTPDYAEVRQWLDDNDIRTFIPNYDQASSLPFRRSFAEHIMEDKGSLAVIPWTLNTEEQWATHEKEGFDGILTDKPAAYLAWRAGR